MLATIIVSVLKVLSPGRWSTPTSRMLSRPVPVHCGTGRVVAVEPGVPVSVGPVPLAVSVGPRLKDGSVSPLVRSLRPWRATRS